jgi:hypothetical protein
VMYCCYTCNVSLFVLTCFLALLFIILISEGDFHAVCKAHFNKIRDEHPTFGSSSTRGMIYEFAPEKVAACNDILYLIKLICTYVV